VYDGTYQMEGAVVKYW